MNTNRRSFLAKSAALAGGAAFPSFSIGQAGPSANARVNLAFIGLGGQGQVNLRGLQRHANVVGLCDVNSAAFQKLPAEMASVPRFKDLRVMLDKLDKDIDAVVVSTPDHAHFWAAYSAMERGKHIFLEKPLAHKIWEARKLTDTARERKLVTQTGNFGRAAEGIRLLKEWIDAGVLGTVREVHGVLQPPRPPEWANAGWQMPPAADPPDGLDWDLWLGSNPLAAYRADIFRGWRMWWDYGSGMAGDWAPHTLDGANFALDLGAPVRLSSQVAPDHSGGHRVRNWSHTTADYPARGDKAPLKLHWYTGGQRPADPALKLTPNGSCLLIVGDKHTLQADVRSSVTRIISMNDAEWLDFRKNQPPRTIPRVKGGHYKEWIDAITGDGPKPGASFDETGPFTEAILLMALCERLGGGELEWDAKNMRVGNRPELKEYINPSARPGFDCGRG